MLNVDKIHELIERELGVRTKVTEQNYGERGIHYTGEETPCTNENCGSFAMFFATFSVGVRVWSAPSEHGYIGMEFKLHWSHRDGGTNGASFQTFYFPATDEVLTADQARAKLRNK